MKPNRLKVCAKCSDCFYAQLGEQEYEGYVPKWFPGEHYGDYVILEIDIETGRITNWNKPTQSQLDEMFANQN